MSFQSSLVLLAGTRGSGIALLRGIFEGVGLPVASCAGLQAKHDRALIDLDCWDGSVQAKALPHAWLESSPASVLKNQIQDFLGRKIIDLQGPIFFELSSGLRMLPLWQQVARELNLDLHIVWLVRDPAEVVASLIADQDGWIGMNSGRAQRLWWRENLSVRESCKNSQNFSFVDFNSVLAAPHAQVTRILRSIPGLEVSEPQLQEVCDSIDVKAMRMSPGEPVHRSLRRLYKHFCRHPLRRRWPSADDIQHLPPDSELVSIPQELLTDPDAWQAVLQRFEGYPAPRCAKQNLPVDDSILLNACGFTWFDWAAHPLLNRLPLDGLANRTIDDLNSGAHQLMLASSRSSPRDDAQCLRIGINVEWPEAERRLHWFQHLKTQDMIWDIDPARVLLMKSLGLPAWWLDPHDSSNGWIDRPEATTLLSWVQHLGLGEPPANHLVVLGSLGSGWDRSLALDGEKTVLLDPPISYFPGWLDLQLVKPAAALAQAGWLIRAVQRSARLVWSGALTTLQRSCLEFSAGCVDEPLVVASPLEPDELRALHRGDALEALAEDRASPETDVLWSWSCDQSTIPSVSVVISSYNYAERIETALESVVNQTAQGLELIVVDDESSDNSVRVIQSWMEDLSRRFQEGLRSPLVRLLLLRHRSNSGLAVARNTAFEAAKADWCFVLDADNRLMPNAVEACFSLAQELKTVPQLAVIHPVIGMEIEAGRSDEQRSLLGGPSWQRESFVDGNVVDAMALVSRRAWRAVGGYTHLEGGWEDYDFWCKLVADGWQGVQCPQLLALYRSHTDAMTFCDTARRQRALSRTLQKRHPWLRLPLAE